MTLNTVLLIDWGNTRIKYTLISLSDCSSANFNTQFNITTASSLIELFTSLENKEFSEHLPKDILKEQLEALVIKKALIASVKSKKDNLELMNGLRSRGIDCQFAQTSRKACDVTCGYEDPKLLGVDRWLAIIAGYKKGSIIGVIDIGSAITLDLVDGAGLHLGGHILPGVRLLNESLSNTANVRVLGINLSENTKTLGNSTTECVDVGIDALVISYLLQSIEGFNNEYGVHQWLITGGDGKYYFNQLKKMNIGRDRQQLNYDQALIFKGLMRLFV